MANTSGAYLERRNSIDRRFFHNSYQLSDRTFMFRVLRRVTTISRHRVRDTSISVATDPFRFAVIIRRLASILVLEVEGYPIPGTSCRPTYGYGGRLVERLWRTSTIVLNSAETVFVDVCILVEFQSTRVNRGENRMLFIHS